ncbi:MAG: endonuclease [Candidatus Nanohaloarchaeota archaeon]|nr:endonuclease [Candidatus Nanohaloarchaeota archaeon]
MDWTGLFIYVLSFLASLLLPAQQQDNFVLHGNVEKVYDGDTFYVYIYNTSSYEKVRLKCIDFPDLHPQNRVDKWIRAGVNNESHLHYCYTKGNELVKQLVLHKDVWIKQDKPWERDKYGRLLGYVYLNSSFDVNKWLIMQGYAMPYYCHVYDKYWEKEGCLWN